MARAAPQKREIWSPPIFGWEYMMTWSSNRASYIYKHKSGRKGQSNGYAIIYKPKSDYFDFHRAAIAISVYLPTIGMEKVTVHVERRSDTQRGLSEMWSTLIQAFERHVYFRTEEDDALRKQVAVMKGE